MKKSNATVIAIFLGLAGAAAPAAAEPPVGRLLASQCFQCHGTNGRSTSNIESIEGKDANKLYEKLLEMKADPERTVMNQQAKVYGDTELRKIADYLATLPSAK